MRAGCTRFRVAETTRAHEPTAPGFLHLLFTLVRTLLSRGWLVFFSDPHRNPGTAFLPAVNRSRRSSLLLSSVAPPKTRSISFKNEAVPSFRIDLLGQSSGSTCGSKVSVLHRRNNSGSAFPLHSYTVYKRRHIKRKHLRLLYITYDRYLHACV